APRHGDATGIGRSVRSLIEAGRLSVAVDGHVDRHQPVGLEARNPMRQTRLVPGLGRTAAAGSPHQQDAGVHRRLVYRLGQGDVRVAGARERGLHIPGTDGSVDDLDALGGEVTEIRAAERTARGSCTRAGLLEVKTHTW